MAEPWNEDYAPAGNEGARTQRTGDHSRPHPVDAERPLDYTGNVATIADLREFNAVRPPRRGWGCVRACSGGPQRELLEP